MRLNCYTGETNIFRSFKGKCRICLCGILFFLIQTSITWDVHGITLYRMSLQFSVLSASSEGCRKICYFLHLMKYLMNIDIVCISLELEESICIMLFVIYVSAERG